MFNGLKTYLTYGDHFCGIELCSIQGRESINVAIIKKTKQTIDLAEVFHVDDQNGLSQKLKNNAPVYLVINNDQVLFKMVPNDSSDTSKKVFKAFPNINLEDFYYEVIDQETMSLITICRKSYIEKITMEFAQHQIPVVNASLGHGPCVVIANYLENGNVQSSNAQLCIEDHKLVKVEPIEVLETQNYNINGIKLSNHSLLAFCGALLIVQDNHHPASNLDHFKEQLKEKYIQKRWFKQGSKAALFSILGILLINFVLFNHYFNSVNTLKENVMVNEATKQSMLVLNNEVNKLQKKVDDMFRNGSSKSSWYIDQLAQSLPETVMLSDLNYQPLSKKIRPNQPILTENNIIMVLGESSDSDKFSLWMAQLEAMPWIEKVEIINYQDVAKQRSEFQIKINMANEQ